MKQQAYDKIVGLLRNPDYPDQKSFLTSVRENHPEIDVSDHTLLSIYSQDFQRFIKRNIHKHNKENATDKYYTRFSTLFGASGGSGIILSLSREVNFPPVIICRIILDEHFKRTMFTEKGVPKGYTTQVLKSPKLVNNDALAKEIQLCIDADENCGPAIDARRHQIGLQYEDTLRECLSVREIPFRDEHYLRMNGYDKTPDFKLEVPFAVDGHVVNWVESKASFGDEESHVAYLRDQYWGYLNRFGPGLVIYWFGFIEELDTQRARGIILMDRFPDNIVTLDSLL